MSRLSPKMRIIVPVGLVLLLGMVFFNLRLLSHRKQAAVVPVVVNHATPAPNAARRAVHSTRPVRPVRPARPKIDASLPAPLRRALSRNAVVVAVLYAPRAPGDDEAVQAARAGAQKARVGFAALNVHNEAVATAVARKVPGSFDPSVLIVRRPGEVAVRLDGYADPEVVAQAAREAR
jgi:hypothetical protein